MHYPTDTWSTRHETNQPWSCIHEMNETMKRDLLIRTFSDICRFAKVKVLILVQNYMQKTCQPMNLDELSNSVPDLIVIIIETNIFRYSFEIGINIETV